MRRLPLLIVLSLLLLALPDAALAKDDPQDQIVITGDVNVPRGTTVGDVVVIDGAVNVAGRVDGDVVAVSGPVRVAGTVDGDVNAISDQVTLLPRARVTGDVNYGDEKPLIAPSATVGGSVSDEGWDQLSDFRWGLVGAFAWWLAVSISSLVLGLALLALAPRAAEAARVAVATSLGRTVAWGIALFVGLPILAVIALVTLVGIPLGVGLLLALVPLCALGYVTSAYLLGRRLVKPPTSRFLAFLAGWGILRVLAIVPFLGTLAWLVAVILGLGALMVALWRARVPTAAPSEERAPAPGSPPQSASA
jgi:hypothetical protein